MESIKFDMNKFVRKDRKLFAHIFDALYLGLAWKDMSGFKQHIHKTHEHTTLTNTHKQL